MRHSVATAATEEVIDQIDLPKVKGGQECRPQDLPRRAAAAPANTERPPLAAFSIVISIPTG
jgi:hypothetical protein